MHNMSPFVTPCIGSCGRSCRSQIAVIRLITHTTGGFWEICPRWPWLRGSQLPLMFRPVSCNCAACSSPQMRSAFGRACCEPSTG